jgi:hypothetical protein
MPSATGYSERLLSISFYSENKNKKCPKKVYSVYGHDKFCKKINFYYTAEIKKIDNNNKLILYLLLIDHEENEQEIIGEQEILLNTLQWHCNLTSKEKNIPAKSITKKEKDQNDIILFGKNHILFGSLYTITFELENYNNQDLIFNIWQYDKKYTVCLNI